MLIRALTGPMVSDTYCMSELANKLLDEFTEEFDEKLARSIKDVSQADSLTHSVMSFVISKHYDLASKELDLYVEFKSDFPGFGDQVGRYIEHGKDLIHAIRMKREMPGLENLSMAKRQEISDAVVYHFDELKSTIKQIEKAEYQMRLTDLRSTVIVVKTFSYCLLALLVGAFLADVYGGLAKTFHTVLADSFERGMNMVFDLFML